MTRPAAVCRRVEVAGRVQGVFFRETCRQEAARRGVTGWVRNRQDGTVEALFEGDFAAVEEMVAWTRRGPAQARVADVVVRAQPAEGMVGFTVR